MEKEATPIAATANINLAKDLNLKTELQKKKLTHKLLFDNGEEIDLTQAGLISSAKPLVGQLKTPSMSLTKGRNNNVFNARTLSVNHLSNSNRTPMAQSRLKVSADQTLKRDDSADDPLQRMVNLQKAHGSATRLKARHASAHIDLQLSRKIRQDVDGIIELENSVTSRVLESNRFKENWQQKPSYVSLHSAMPKNRASRSLPRGTLAGSTISDHKSQVDVPILPLI